VAETSVIRTVHGVYGQLVIPTDTVIAILTGDAKRSDAGFTAGGNEGTNLHRDATPVEGGTQGVLG
jgi:hypothetical protein